MFKFLEDSDNRLGAYIASLIAGLLFTLILSLSLYFYYLDLNMAKLGYQATTIQGTATLIYQKVETKDCGK